MSSAKKPGSTSAPAQQLADGSELDVGYLQVLRGALGREPTPHDIALAAAQLERIRQWDDLDRRLATQCKCAEAALSLNTGSNARRMPPSLLPIAPSSNEQFTAQGLSSAQTTLGLLRMWIASVEALDSLAGPGEGDMEAIGLSMGAICRQLERVNDDDVPAEFYSAKGILHTIDLYFAALAQGCALNEVSTDVLSQSAGHAYQLLAGVCSVSESAS